jgi:hypothetical protein
VFQGWIPNGTGEPVGAATGQLATVVCVHAIYIDSVFAAGKCFRVGAHASRAVVPGKI